MKSLFSAILDVVMGLCCLYWALSCLIDGMYGVSVIFSALAYLIFREE